MKRTCTGLALATAFAATLAAQDMPKTKSKTETKIKNGKDVNIVGCLQRSTDGNGFVLSNLSGDAAKTTSYQLVLDDDVKADDLQKHVGHKIEVKGKAADQKDGEIEVKTETKTEVEHGDDKETKVKTKVEGDLINLPFLGVHSVKMISAVCP